MTQQLTGRWKNNYNSCINLRVNGQGVITGTYGSDTGSTGTYYLVGNAALSEPTDTKGQNLVISVFWRSINGGVGDPSWHWVTTQCGQLQNNATINVIQSLVATTDFPGLADIGNYVDKLVYTPTEDGPKDPIPVAPSFSDPQVNNPLNGCWQTNDSEKHLKLSVKKTEYGWLTGELKLEGETISMLGFTDIYADKGSLQGVTLCGFSSNTQTALALNGSFDPKTGLLTLSRWFGLSTSNASSYVQADLATWMFKLV